MNRMWIGRWRIGLHCTYIAGILFPTLMMGLTVAAPPPGAALYFSLQELVEASETIATGTIGTNKPGRMVDDGVSKLQFVDHEFVIDQTIKGAENNTVYLEQVDMSSTLTSSAGPPYETGERYLLFLRTGESENQITLAQGRYLSKDGTLVALGIGVVADLLNEMSESEAIRAVRDEIKE